MKIKAIMCYKNEQGNPSACKAWATCNSCGRDSVDVWFGGVCVECGAEQEIKVESRESIGNSHQMDRD